MKYISTRGDQGEKLSFCDTILSGVARDGGLYVPIDFPYFSEERINSFKNLSYEQIAFNVMYPFVGEEIPEEDFRNIINKSYTKFRDAKIAPLVSLNDNLKILELFHGPTLAFKDFALQFLGNLFDYILEKNKEDVVIIGATSGDTGSAAIHGCLGTKRIKLFMLHPEGKVSGVQRKQMTTINEPNIFNLAISGTFDDCQNMVKYMFQHSDFIQKRLVAVNSINWARIMAQITYYFYAYFQFGKKGVDFVVPTGNFGDILAGYYAKKMGLPIGKLVVSTNSNDILDRFFKANDYSQKSVCHTCAPSMDIQISSNFERLLFDLYGCDQVEIKNLMQGFKENKKLQVSSDVFKDAQDIFLSYASDDKKIKKTIKDIYQKYNYLLDPHTATAVDAYKDLQLGDSVILATAHPAKFPAVTQEVLNFKSSLPAKISDSLKGKEYMFGVENDLEKVKDFIIRR